MAELAALVDDWRLDAACVTTDPELFFPLEGDADRRAQVAKRICGTCPVRRQCLESALAAERGAGDNSRYGIFGGLSGKQRYAVYRCRIGRRQHTDGCPEAT